MCNEINKKDLTNQKSYINSFIPILNKKLLSFKPIHTKKRELLVYNKSLHWIDKTKLKLDSPFLDFYFYFFEGKMKNNNK